MLAGRIVMRPMDQSALLIPNILARKTDHIANLQTVDAWSKIDVVLDQNRLSRSEADDEFLMR